MKRSVIIVSTSDQPAQLRLNAAYVGTAIAEYFREQGKTSHLDDGFGHSFCKGAA
jgi:Flagellar biosynthesis/type III secretory pathway ATPase